MAKNVRKIAESLGATIIGQVPNAGGGAIGAARLAQIIRDLQSRLVSSQGRRAGQPTDSGWVRHPKVPMSEAPGQRLIRLAERASREGRKVSPMQIAARILEDALADIPEQ
jgi:hypothetical protein